MSTSRHLNKICISAVALILILTILLMNGKALGVSSVSKPVKYESTLFDTSYVHKIDIVMDDWDTFIENCEKEEYSACTVVVDGEKHANIAIRAKGNTSLSSVRSSGSRRYSFKLEFDHYEEAKTLDGLDKLCLNNLIQDTTMMKDYLAYQLMYDFGVDSPLCSFAYLTVNGEDWGLYLAVEGIEDSFLERNYWADPGELYKPDSMSFGGGRGNGKSFNMDDFDFGDDDSRSEWKNRSGGGRSRDNRSGDTSGGASVEGSQSPSSSEGDSQQDGTSAEGNSQTPWGDFPSDGQFPTPPDGFSGDGQFPSFGGDGYGGQSAAAQGGGFKNPFSGMGSDDVKLKYSDDDPDSYSNIFDSAKTTVSYADKKRLIESLKKLTEYTDLEDVLDMDEVLRYFVVHNFICNGDSYTGAMIHNYYLHESDGKLGMIPWDYNLGYGTFQGGDASGTVNTSIDNPVSGGDVNDRPMVGWIFSDEAYTEQYHELFASFIEKWFSNGELEKMISDTADMIRPYVEKDPTKFCTTEDFEKGVETLSQFVALRGEAVSRQLAGDDTAVDAGDLTLSEMGSMGGGRGGRPGRWNETSGENSTDYAEAQNPDTTGAQASAKPQAEDGSGSAAGGGGFTPPPAGAGGSGNQLPADADSDVSQKSPDVNQQTSDGSSDNSRQPANETGDAIQQSTGGDGDSSQQLTNEGRDNSQQPTDVNSVNSQQSENGVGGASRQPSGGDSSRFGNRMPEDMRGGNSKMSFWSLTGVSILVLAAGLVIAIRKK
ncbi:MAG: CotH kinase family protein [Eubacteriales bacterium]|nr:CotH kinase family protein [Eubacteriales bacterium]